MAKVLLIVTLLLLPAIWGCSHYRKEIDSNPPFASHHFRYYDVAISWQAEKTTNGIRLAGTVTNLRSFYLRDLELTARLVDEQGKVMARGHFADFSNYIPPGKTETFRLEVASPPAITPEKVRFTYVYWLAEEPPAFRGYSDVPYFGSFESFL